MPTTLSDQSYGIETSVAVKAPVAAVAVSNIPLSGLAPFPSQSGSYTPNGGNDNGTAPDRVLVIAQTDPTQNGLYDVNSAGWTRCADFDGNRDAVWGTLIVAPAAGGGTVFYQLTSENPITIGTTAIEFVAVASFPNVFYARTTIEIANNITPADYSYPPGHVFRYAGLANTSADQSSAFNQAALSGAEVYAPEGFYLCNFTVTTPTRIRGDGSTKTILQPYSANTAILLNNAAPPAGTPAWHYGAEVRGIGFWGPSPGGVLGAVPVFGVNAVGIGVAYGSSSPSGYVAGMELAGGSTAYYGCRWLGLRKAIQFTYGNIGQEFRACGITGCYYGLYCLDNKFSAAQMHAGNKYWYGGELDNCVVAVYLNDDTGYYGLKFDGAIFEANFIDHYAYASARTYTPTVFKACGQEDSGQRNTSPPATVTVDVWTGDVLTTKTITPQTTVLDGGTGTYEFDGGYFSDCAILTAGIEVNVTACHVENQSGFGGAPCNVTAGSHIFMRRCHGNGGPQRESYCTVFDYYRLDENSTIDSSPTDASCKGYFGAHRSNLAGSQGSCLVSETFTKAASWGAGSISQQADGVIFPTCNQVGVGGMTSTQWSAAASTEFETPATPAWIVVTCDVKATLGAAKLYLWNEGSVQFTQGQAVPFLNQWFTYCAYGYSPGSQSMQLMFGAPPTTQSCTMRFSAFQAHAFATEEEALSFLESRAYAQFPLAGNAALTPGAIGSGSDVTGTITVTGAVLGDYVQGAYGADLQGVDLRVWVSAANTVSYRLQNDTGGSVTPANATIYVKINKT